MFDQALMQRWMAPVAVVALVATAPLAVQAQAVSADAKIQALSTEVLDAIKADKAIQAGDVSRINALVDAKVMPQVNFQRMTASAVGRAWRTATPEQQQRLQAEFKTLLVRTYAGALSQVKDQKISLKPQRGGADDPEVVVRTEVKGKGEPIQLDYRLEKAGADWKIYDVNVMGVWLVDQYRNSFATEINANGVDGLIKSLADKNAKASAGAKG
jgi:phospholipid transport system substrate-binding protein